MMSQFKEYAPVIALTFAMVYGLRTVVFLTTETGNSSGY